jgi:hypothetical protein
VTLSLRKGRDISGRVVFPVDVIGHHGFAIHAYPAPGGRTDANGGFLVRGAPLETVFVGAWSHAGEGVYSATVEVPAETTSVEIPVERVPESVEPLEHDRVEPEGVGAVVGAGREEPEAEEVAALGEVHGADR